MCNNRQKALSGANETVYSKAYHQILYIYTCILQGKFFKKGVMRRNLGMRSIFRCFQVVGSTAEEVPPLFIQSDCNILMTTEPVYACTRNDAGKAGCIFISKLSLIRWRAANTLCVNVRVPAVFI